MSQQMGIERTEEGGYQIRERQPIRRQRFQILRILFPRIFALVDYLRGRTQRVNRTQFSSGSTRITEVRRHDDNSGWSILEKTI